MNLDETMNRSTQFYKFAEKNNCSQRNEKFIQLILSKSKREESKTEMATLEYRRVSYLRYYNITPTFILEVKLRISAWITHNVSPCSSCCIFFLCFFARTLFHFLCIALALSLTISYFPVTLALLFVASSLKGGRMDRLSRRILS